MRISDWSSDVCSSDLCGVQYGRVRALFDENGKQVPSAGPSIPVQVLGLSGVPDAGDDFVVVEDERLAKEVAQQRDAKRRETRLVNQAGNRLEVIKAQMGEGSGQLRDRKSTRQNYSHQSASRIPSYACN